jgi:peptidoglycan/LPS O-acetylase OafA/YrhL
MPALTGMRFILAIWVVFYHQVTANLGWFEQYLPLPITSIALTGYAAVGVFFVLSGFVLAYNYDLTAAWSKRDWSRFAVARFARIYPAYLLGLICIAPLIFYRFTLDQTSQMNVMEECFAGILNLTLLQSWLPQTALTWNDPGWSLSNEAFFYACLPLVGVVIWRASGIRAFAASAMALWALSLLGPAIALWAPVSGFGDVPATNPPDTMVFWTNVVRYNPVIRLPEFCMGVLLGRIFIWLESNRPNFHGRGWRFYLPGIAVAVALLSQADEIPYPLVHNGLLLPANCLIVLGLALSGGWLSRWLSTSVLVFLGNASYSVYILHVPVASWLTIFWRRILQLQPIGSMWLITYLLCVVGVASLVYKLLEEPSYRWLKKRLNGRLEKAHTAVPV